MDTASSPQPLAVGEKHQNNVHTDPTRSYAAQLHQKQSAETISKLVLCPVSIEHGEPTVDFTMEDVNEFTREEGMHQAVVMKFSYGKPDLQDIRRLFATQFDVYGHCNIGQLDFRHLLVRFDLYTDFVNFLSRSAGYFKDKGEEYFFRTFPWSIGFNPKEETSMALVWISLPGLAPNFFAKRSLMSIASAVGKPIAVDKATQDRTRPSTARIKVLLDLLDEHPNKVKLRIIDKGTAKSVVYYQLIVYDNLPKYCCYCKHQGHDELTCRIVKGKNGEVARTNTVDENSSEQLKGDARDFLNAKKGAQKVVQIAVTHHNNTKQLGMQVDNTKANATGSAANEVKSGTAAHYVYHENAMGISDAQARNTTATTVLNQPVGIHNQDDVFVHNGDQVVNGSKHDIPASTIFARMNTAMKVNQNDAAALLNHVQTASSVQKMQNQDQQVGSKNNGIKNTHGAYKDLGKVDNENGGNKTKKGEVWTVVTSRKSPVNKEAAAVQLDSNSRRISSGKVLSSANKFDVLEHDNVEKLELAISNEETMSKQLIKRDEKDREAQGSGIEVKNLNVQQQYDEQSSNVPTIQFSSPHIEHIIKDAQEAMMRHTNMGRQPISTLNTSVLEIPSQSEKSIEEHEVLKQGEGQNESENEEEDSECESGQIQSDSEEEDDGYDETNDEDSSEHDTCGSENEEMLSVGSPSGVRMIECGKLNAEAPAFVPTAERQQIGRNTTNTSLINQQQQSIVVVQEKSNDEDNLAGTGNKEMEQKQQEVAADRKAIGTNSNGMQQSPTGQTKPNVGQQQIVQTTVSSSARNQPRRGMPRFRNTYRSGEVPIQCDTLEMANDYIARVSEETTVRQLPMRVAKQKQVVSNTSNRYKK